MANNDEKTVETLLKGMENFITTKTVVGEAIHLNGTIILPLADVSFGLAAGSFKNDSKNNNSGAMGGKMSPSAVLVIKDGVSKLVNVKNQDIMTKLLDMVPDLISKFTKNEDEKTDDEIIDDIAADI